MNKKTAKKKRLQEAKRLGVVPSPISITPNPKISGGWNDTRKPKPIKPIKIPNVPETYSGDDWLEKALDSAIERRLKNGK